jgi:thiamine-phosphate pyrophosphorylase
MCEIICVTNRHLCDGDFLDKIKTIAYEKRASKIILREKDLGEEEYKTLAIEVMRICDDNNITCILHNFYKTAIELNANGLHLPLHVLEKMTYEENKVVRNKFRYLGASCHSVEEAVKALNLGCTYIVAGHVFQTDCKKDLPPRGLGFLKNVCDSVDIPVYAIGGINGENMGLTISAGATGVCMMSGFMRTFAGEEN